MTRIALSDFRGYARLALQAGPEPVVLTGPNGAGKTNLLEALSFLAPGRGLRGARLCEATRHGAAPGAGWAVAATLAGAHGATELGTGLRPAEGDGAPGDRRVVRVDGKAAGGAAALARALGVLWLTPAMDRLFQDGAPARRRFLDRIVFGHDPGHAGRLAAYERALRERARLLRDGRRDPAWLGALEGSMARHGVAVAASRREVAGRLDAALAARRGPFPAARLAVTGTLESALDAMPAVAAEEAFAASLAAGRARDAETGGAAEGPHRSDLAVSQAATGTPAALCSTGEQKTLLIAVVLAHARLAAAGPAGAPVLLLDDVTAHLDERHRAALFEALLELGAQAWLTGTDRAPFARLARRARFLAVADARVRDDDA